MKAVLTGDIINSKRISPEIKKALYQRFSAYLKKLSEGRDFQGEISRGDWFQCLVEKPELALTYAIKIKLYLRSFALLEKSTALDRILSRKPSIIPKAIIDARISIGIGEIDFLDKKLATSDGEAFQLSGKLLDQMKNQRNSLSADINSDGLREEFQTLFLLLDTIIQKTTPPQCQVMLHKLNGRTETQIAHKLNINQSAVNQRSTSAGWKAIETCIKYYENRIRSLSKK
jgi:hypothetical protein